MFLHKIEEIRINKKDSNNKITNLRVNEIKEIKRNKNLKKNNQFYIGLDEIRDRIDQLDEIRYKNSSKKWFEGDKNIESKINKKMKVMACYKSQFITNRKNKFIFDYIKQQNSYLGKLIGCEYAEAFCSKEAIKIKDLDTLL